MTQPSAPDDPPPGAPAPGGALASAPPLPDPAVLRRRGAAPAHVPLVPDARTGGLVLDLTDRHLGGTWVRIAFADPGAGGFSRATLTAVADGEAGRGTLALPMLAQGGGRFAWIGRLPPGLAAIEIAPSFAEGLPRLRELAISEVGRPEITARAFLKRPGLAARGVFWRSLGKRVRGRSFIGRALEMRDTVGYAAWIARFDALTDADRARIRAEAEALADAPLISIVMPVYNPEPRVLEAALRSVRAQLYPHWELCITDDASPDPRIPRILEAAATADPRIKAERRPENGHISRATNDALARARGAYVAFMDHDDVLPENALHEVASALRADPALDLIYSDEDKIDARGRRFDPHFKPDWNRELLYAQNYVNHLTVVRTALVREVGGLRPGFEGSQDHDLLLRLVDRIPSERVRHIPRVLYHWRAAAGSGTFSDRALARAESSRLQALQELLAARGAPHRAERGIRGFNRLVRALPDPAPLVSVVIPTRDRAELLEVALRGLLTGTDYPALEVIVVDNGSVEPRTERLFTGLAEDPRVRVLPAPGPFNFSALSNAGAEAARGTVLLFLNNDVEVIEPGWLTELASIAVDPEVGAVGAMLIYPDRTIQHGGVVLGAGGIAGHSHLGLPHGEPGYASRMLIPQEVSAVTGACLAMRRDVFTHVGGFDAAQLAVAFNDIDLCLKVTGAGYRIVWTPNAVLVHHESKSRGSEDTPEKRARFERETATMIARWGQRLGQDPHYNPNLSRASAQFRLW